MSKLRLDKFLANMGLGTRTQVKKIIQKNKVYVNGTCIKNPEQKIDIENDTVEVDGNKILFVSYEYYMLNKPAGVVSATYDNRDKTVLDLLADCDSPRKKDLFPIGRLDKDTEGLLILSNDGQLAHQLLTPKKHIGKVYYAKIDGVVTKQDVALFAKGLKVDEEFQALPAKLEIIKSDICSEIMLEIFEGKFHQVKRMFEAVNKKVIYLKRVSMGNIVLDEKLQLGQYRKLTDEEIKQIKEI